MTDDERSQPVRYTYKPSLAGSPQIFELTGQGLSYKSGYGSAIWRYADIARIRLSYRPVSMLAHRFRADLQHKDGRELTIISATWAGIVALTPQNDSYRAFIEDLHRRVAAERGGAICLAGTNKVVFALSCAVFAAVMIALAVMFVRALMTADYAAALFMLGFAAWFGWYTGRMLMRNKPRSYDPAHVPRELLP